MADTRIQKNKVISSDEWYTPKEFIEKLGPFDIDPCAPMNPPYDIAPISYNKEQDGLAHDWNPDDIVWLNPPYSSKLLYAFVEKLAEHGNGIALLINRTDNRLFRDIIFPRAKSMVFLDKRIKFMRSDGSSGYPYFGSVLVAFGEIADIRLKNCDIAGKYVVLN